MALTKCKECGQDVSTSAKACPKCGAPVGHKVSPWLWGCGCLVLSGFGFLFMLAVLSGSGQLSSKPRTVIYSVDGTANTASLTYQNAQVGTEQEEVRPPWSKSLSVNSGSFVYISAQNQEDHGSITVRISVDGIEFKRSDARGAYTIATASGRCP